MCHFGRFLAYFGVVYIRDFDRKLIITFSNYDSSYASIKKSSFYKEIEKSEYYNLYEEKLNELDEKYQKIKQEIDKLKKDPFSVKSYGVFICTKISVRTRNNPKLKGYTKTANERFFGSDYSGTYANTVRSLIETGYNKYFEPRK